MSGRKNFAIMAVICGAILLAAGIGTFALRAQAQSDANSSGYAADMFKALRWRNIGPNRGGRSIASAGTPSRPLEYYFGAVGGGLWKTTDGGVSWNPVTDGQLHSSSVGAVAVSESNPDVIYIGMGEACLRGNIMQGDGVYKSTDAGKTWQHMGLEDTQIISRIRINPTNPDIVYVAALGHPSAPNDTRGVFKSTDGGKNWKKVLFRDNKSGAIDLTMDRNNPNVLYAALWEAWRVSWGMSSGGPGSGLLKSTDGGDTWTEITRNPGMPSGVIGRIGVSISGGDGNRVYALIENENGGVFRSDDGGANWTKTNDDRKLRQRAFYYTHIFADPKDKDTVYALNTGFYKSTDGGKTFNTTLRPPHGDNHDLWIDPTNPKRMINSNDGSANVSVNGGQTWTSQDVPTAQLYHVATTKDFPYQACGAQQDNSTVCVQSVSGGRGGGGAGTWPALYAVGGGESGYIAPSPKDPNIFYAGSQGALLTRFDRRTNFSRDIEVYPRFFSGEASKDLPDRWQWTYPIVFSPFDANTLYTSSQFLYKTTNDGQSWQKISGDLTRHDPKTLGDSGGPITHDMNGPEVFATIFTIAPSRKEPNTIWTGSDDGLVYITRDGGKNWSNVTPPGMPDLARVSLIDASPNKAGAAYVAAKNYLQDDRAPYAFKTDDYGKTWKKIVMGIRGDDYVHAVREDTKRPGLLYAGTEHGIYVSFDDGDHWQSLSLNLPDTQVSDIEVMPDDLVIATHGRSMWVLDDIAALRQIDPKVSTASLHLYAPNDAVRRIHPLSIDYYLKAKADKVTIDILDGKGQVIRSFTGPEENRGRNANAAAAGDDEGFRRPPARVGIDPGLNRFSWDLRYPGATTFPGMILWGANVEQGPLAVPGEYKVRVTAAGQTETQAFRISEDPRSTATQADLQAEFVLAMQVRDRVSAANQAVIDARKIRDQVNDRIAKVQNAELRSSGESLDRKLTDVEEAIYQVKNRSGQDPLNFAIKLNNRIGHLMGVIEEGDYKPTDQTYAAFNELSKELDVQLAKLKLAMTADVPAFNKQLTAASLQPVSLDAPDKASTAGGN